MSKIIKILIPTMFILISCSGDNGERGLEILPDMVHPVPYEAFSESDITKDGKSMLEPVKGTIPRGHKVYRYGKGKNEALRAGREVKNPLVATKESIARGRQVYESYCLSCHGPNGKGDGPLIPRFPNPPSFTTKRLKAYSDGRLYHIIMRGSGDMPSHAAQIIYEDRWKLVHYINELQK